MIGPSEPAGVAHCRPRPYTPKTNGMVERFNGRIQSEVLGITVASHGDLETLLERCSTPSLRTLPRALTDALAAEAERHVDERSRNEAW